SLRDAVAPSFSPDFSRMAGVVDRFGPNGQTGEVKVWDLSNGQEVLTVPWLSGSSGDPNSTANTGIHFDGRRILILERDPKGWFVRVLDGTPRPSPNGKP